MAGHSVYGAQGSLGEVDGVHKHHIIVVVVLILLLLLLQNRNHEQKRRDIFAFEATLAERVARESALYWI